MKVLAIIFLAVAYISSVYGAVGSENAPVTNEHLIKQGYSCISSVLGPMKNGEVNNNPSDDKCLLISCSNGLVQYESCGVLGGPCIGPGDKTKPYPDCCFTKVC